MPWVTPSLREVRQQVRDDITAALSGAASFVSNSVLRVMSDAQAGLARLILMYLDWLALQLMPDTAETEWLDRHGDIWLVNADGTTGRKDPTFARGTVTFTGTAGTVVPIATLLTGPIDYETTEEIVIGAGPSESAVRALSPGTVGNLVPGETLSVQTPMIGVDNSAVVVQLSGGTNTETDEELRERILERIQKPPMGGDADDYVAWAKAIPAVTRAWCAPLEMGMGTVTLRFMMDALRADNDGFPLPEDVAIVRAELDRQRPVAVRDFFCVSPAPQAINFTLDLKAADSMATRGAVEKSVSEMLLDRARPASSQGGHLVPATTVYQSWVAEAVSRVVEDFTLTMNDIPPIDNGRIAMLGTVTYVEPG